MHIFLELWNPKPSWTALNIADRKALMGLLGDLTQPIIEAESIEVLGWGKCDPKVDHPEGHQYFALWRAPECEALNQIREAIHQGGWYEYFDQVNVTGKLDTPYNVIGEHLSM